MKFESGCQISLMSRSHIQQFNFFPSHMKRFSLKVMTLSTELADMICYALCVCRLECGGVEKKSGSVELD